MADDILVNVDIKTKGAEKSVDGLNKRLKENTRQTKAIEAELKKLEKEYKSVATAIKKLPTQEAAKLAKSTNEAAKSSNQLGKQYEKTAQKVVRANERASGTQQDLAEVIAVTGAVILVTGERLEILASRTANAALQTKKFLNEIGPTLRATKTLAKEGVQRVTFAFKNLMPTLKASGQAIQEQVQIFRGYQHVTVRTNEALIKLNNFLFFLGNGANDVKRAFQGMRDANFLVNETLSRGRTLLNFFRDGLGAASKSVMRFRSDWFGTFGPSSGGAAQINNFQKLVLNLQFALENAGATLRRNFGAAVAKVSQGIQALGQQMLVLTKAAASKGLELFRVGLEKAGPVIVAGIAKIQTLSELVNVKLNNGFLAALKGMISFGSGTVSLSQRIGLLNKGLIGAVETGNIFGLGMLGLGTILKTTENSVLDFIGSVVQMAGVISLSFATAITIAIGAVGQLMIAIGDKLLSVMDKFEAKFVKAQQITKAFEFVIRGFGKTMGEEAVGNLRFWNDQVAEMTSTTAISATETQKSIKILIAEGQALGLTADQNASILKRAGDISAATGRKLSEVSLGIAKSLAGTAGALDSLGIFTDKATLEHSKFAHANHVVADGLDKNGKAILVMNSIFEQTVPLIGAAADQLNTVAGANKQFSASLDDLQAKLGSQNMFFVKFTQLQALVVQGFANMPTVILDTISIMIDFGGVALKIVGTFTTMLITLVTIKAAFETLNIIIAGSAAVQTAFNFVLGIAATRMKINIVLVTNLRTAMIAMAQVMKAGVVFTFTQMNAAILTANRRMIILLKTTFMTRSGFLAFAVSAQLAAASVAQLTVALLTNPIFLTGTAVVGGIILIAEAIEQMTDRLEKLNPTLKKSGEIAKETASFYEQLADMFGAGFQAAVNVTIVLIGNLMKLVRWVQMAAAGYKMLWGAMTRNSKMMQEAEKDYDTAKKKVLDLATVTAKAAEDVLGVFGGVAQAAEDAGKEVEKLGKKIEHSIQGFKKQSFDIQVRLALSETPFEQARINLDLVNASLDNTKAKALAAVEAVMGPKRAAGFAVGSVDAFEVLLTKMKAMGQEEKAIKEIEKARDSIAAARLAKLNAEKAVSARIKDAVTKITGIRDAALTLHDSAIQKIETQKQKQLDVLAAMRKGVEELEKDVKSRTAQLQLIKDAEKAVKASAKAAKKSELDKQLKAQQAALDDILKKNNEIQMGLDNAGLDQVGQIMKSVEAQNKLVDAKIQELNLAKGPLAAEQIAALERQKELNKLQGSQEVKKVEEAAAKETSGKQMSTAGFDTGAIDNLSSIAETMGGALGGMGEMVGSFASSAGSMISSVVALPMAIVQVGNMIMDAILGIFDTFTSFFEKLTDFPTMLADASEALFDSIIRLITDFLPNLVRASIDITMDSIKAIMKEIPEAINMLMESIPDLVQELWQALPELVQMVVTNAITQLPKSIISLIKMVIKSIVNSPKIFTEIIPAIIQAFIMGIKEAIQEIAAELEGLFSGDFLDPKDLIDPAEIAKNFTNVSDEIFAVIDLESQARQFDAARELKKAGDDFLAALWRIWRSVVGLFESAWQVASALFGAQIGILKEVWEFAMTIFGAALDIQKGIWELSIGLLLVAWDTFKEIWDASIGFFVDFMTGVFQPIWEAMVALFDLTIGFFKDTWDIVLKLFSGEISVFEAVGEFWHLILETGSKAFGIVFEAAGKIFDNVLEAFGTLWDNTKKIFGNALEGFKDVFGSFGEVLVDAGGKMAEGFKNAITGVGDVFAKLGGALSNAFGGVDFGGMGASIADGFAGAINGILDAFRSIFNVFIDIVNGMKIPKVEPSFKVAGKKIRFTLWNDIDVVPGDIARFATGGLVQSAAAVSALTGFGSDTVPAALTPGEFVINKGAVDTFGPDFFSRLNAGVMPGGGGQTVNVTQTVNVKIDAGNNKLDEGFIRSRVIPSVKKELKQSTLRGELIISKKGTF